MMKIFSAYTYPSFALIKISKFGVVTSLLLLGLLTGCAQSDKADNKANADKASKAPSSTAITSATQATADKISDKVSNPLPVYASTNVWSAVTGAIGGEKIQSTAAINQPNQDPHNYQASANDKLAMSNAKIIIVNGGGYDTWAGTLASTLPAHPMVIDAVNLSQLNPSATAHNVASGTINHADHAEFNEHVFYSLDAVQKVAKTIATQLATTDTANAAFYNQNLAKFEQEITRLKGKAQQIGANRQLTAVYTEPVTGYLLESMGIKDITLPDFVRQAETDAGVSAKVLADTKNLLTSHKASILVLNAQTEDATAKILQDTAMAAHIPVVKVYETLPPNTPSYVSFIDKTLDDFAQAIAQLPPATVKSPKK